MAETNLDKLSAQTGEFSSGVNGVGLTVDTVTATSSGDLPVSSVDTGDAVMGAYKSGGAAVSPGTITTGHVASDASSGDTVVVIWADQT